MLRAIVILVTSLVGLAAAQGAGRLALDPMDGTVGTAVVATATGLEPGKDVELVWMDADAQWNVGDGTFHGVTAVETRTVLGTATVAADGQAVFEFTVPSLAR